MNSKELVPPADPYAVERVVRRGDALDLVSVGEIQDAIREQLAAFYQEAAALWERAAKIGGLLAEAHSRVPDEEWDDWVAALEISTYQAFLLMRCSHYPELMRQHKPGNLEAVARLLPQGQGTAYDREIADRARRLYDGGMSQTALMGHFHASRNTVLRWTDRERYEKLLQRGREQEMTAAQRSADETQRRTLREMKAKGGPAALAYEQLLKAASALDTASREATGDAKRALNAALSATYEAKDRTMEAEAMR